MPASRDGNNNIMARKLMRRKRVCIQKSLHVFTLSLDRVTKGEQVSSVLYQSSFATDATKEVVREEKRRTTKLKRREKHD